MTHTAHPEHFDVAVPVYGNVVVPSGAGGAATGPLFAFLGGASQRAHGSRALLPDLVLPRPSAA